LYPLSCSATAAPSDMSRRNGGIFSGNGGQRKQTDGESR